MLSRNAVQDIPDYTASSQKTADQLLIDIALCEPQIPHPRHFKMQWIRRSSSKYSPCKIWGLHGGDYEECRLLGYKNPVRTSQATHYVSTTEHSRLTLCKIWGFHGGDYEECRLLEYKNSVRTSQETQYVSATEHSRLTLCNIWGLHGGDYGECRLLEYKNSVRTSQETR
jgi:hypothetical protein